MTCPSCEGKLDPVVVLGTDESMQCSKCGGYLIANWVVNALAEGRPLAVFPQQMQTMGVGRVGTCPRDTSVFVSPPSELVPGGLSIGTCTTCHDWWFPNNELFSFAIAMKAKHDYEQLWKKKEYFRFAYPAFGVLLATGMLAGGVWFVQRQQRIAVSAQNPVSDLTITYIGEGAVDIKFMAKVAPGLVEIDRDGKLDVLLAPQREADYYVVRLSGKSRGEYVIKVFGISFPFTIN